MNSSILDILDYNKVLAKGYAMLKDPNDNISQKYQTLKLVNI